MIDFVTKRGNRYKVEMHGGVKLLCEGDKVMGKFQRVVRLEEGKTPVIDYYRNDKELWTFCTTDGDEVERIYENDQN